MIASFLIQLQKKLIGIPRVLECRVLGRRFHVSGSGCQDHAPSQHSIRFGFDPSPPPVHRRVVVTGIGFVTPFGLGVDCTWDSMLLGASALSSLERHDLPQVRSYCITYTLGRSIIMYLYQRVGPPESV